MRITENVRALRALRNATLAAERFDNAAQVASSGKRVSKPSDDPASYARGLAQNARLGQLGTRAENLDRASSDLEIAENALAGASGAVVRARELATELANGIMNAQDRARAAQEVRAIRETLVGFANTRGASGYLFGGTKTDVPPFDTTGTFQGNQSALQIEIGDGVVVDASVKGSDAFGVTGVSPLDAFGELDALAVALETNDLAGIRSSLDGLDTVHEQLVSARSDAGAKIERFRAASAFVGDAKIVVSKALAGAVEADPVSAYAELTNAKAAYERALEVTQKILSLTSLDRG